MKPESTPRIYWNREMETLGPERQRAIEEPKLLRQLEYAWRASAFYRRKWLDAGIDPRQVQCAEALVTLPFTEKDELQEGMTYLLPRIVGLGWAKHLTYTGETFDVRQAERIGFVTLVVPLAHLQDVALRMARTIATYPPLGVRHAKLGLELAAEGNLQAALTYELDAEMACFAEAEVRTKLRAFANRRKPAGRTRKDT